LLVDKIYFSHVRREENFGLEENIFFGRLDTKGRRNKKFFLLKSPEKSGLYYLGRSKSSGIH